MKPKPIRWKATAWHTWPPRGNHAAVGCIPSLGGTGLPFTAWVFSDGVLINPTYHRTAAAAKRAAEKRLREMR